MRLPMFMGKRRTMYDLVLLVTAFVAIVLFLRWREPHMLYYPNRPIDQTPDQLGLKYDDVTLAASDGVKINGWFVHAPDAPRSPRSTILFFHGNAGNISHRMEKLQVLGDLGVDTFIIDYRGYGRSEGQPNEQGTYRDALAAYEYLTNGAPGGRALPSQSIIIYGESLGSAVAVDLAAKQAVGGVIIEEAFTSVGDVGQKMFPFLPVRWLVRNKYDTLSKIGRIKAPLLIFHSRDDEIIPFRHAQRLLAAANEPKQLVELTGGHNDAFAVNGETYRAALKDFLIQCSH
jgi:fermentation-respiration switch protein FrsA (DUF1100 family)